ncbi:myb domain-containing protein [Heterostelium album PN500]|uniref:Myb domain-containing protein n=1 Tax=Heterostelium pallidum (strain ATCC 26659 / Pp 5 / PN500) TaxID=670386 RepID=D3BE29_HETP5|nr:myb domain-containing protein [Heterostelium album PN500]EFA80160.1 myb domain-containing protein [Heterostelium album PN500]|eukprot:XP_020432280.1 myb domain-containing protein [Heterostelium album PN500]
MFAKVLHQRITRHGCRTYWITKQEISSVLGFNNQLISSGFNQKTSNLASILSQITKDYNTKMSDLMKIGGLLCADQNSSSSTDNNRNGNHILKNNGKDSEIDFDHLRMLSNSGDDPLSKHSLKKPLPAPSLNNSTSGLLFGNSLHSSSENDSNQPETSHSGGSIGSPLNSTIISVTNYSDRSSTTTGNSSTTSSKASVSTATNGTGSGYSPSSMAPQLSIGSSSASPNVSSTAPQNSSTSSSPITGSTFCHPDLTSSLPPLPTKTNSLNTKDKEEDLNFSQLAKSFINNSFLVNNNPNSNNSNPNSILNTNSISSSNLTNNHNNNNNSNNTNKNKGTQNEMVLNSIMNGNFLVSPTSSPPIQEDKQSMSTSNTNNSNINSNSSNNSNNTNQNDTNGNNIYQFVMGDEGGSSGELDSIPAGNYDSDDDRQSQKQSQKYGSSNNGVGEHPVSSRKLWSQEECCQLLELVLKLDPQSFKSKESENRWRMIASELGRTVTSTRKKYMRLMNRWSSSTPTPSFSSQQNNNNTSNSNNSNNNNNYINNSIPDRNNNNNNSNDRKRKDSFQYDQQIPHQQQQQQQHQYSQKVELLPQPYPHHHQQSPAIQYHRYNSNENTPPYYEGYQHGYIVNQQPPPQRYPITTPVLQQPVPVYQHHPLQQPQHQQHQHQHQQQHQHHPSQIPIHHTTPTYIPFQHHSFQHQQQQQHQFHPASQPAIKRNKTSIPSPSDQPYYFIPNEPQNPNIPLQMMNLQQSINNHYTTESNSSPTLSPNPHSSPSQQSSGQTYGFRVISEQLTNSIPFQPKRRPKKSNGKSD